MDADHNIFPNLRSTYLEIFADRMGKEHEFITKITLHHTPFHTYNEGYQTINYSMCFHILEDGDDDLSARIHVFKGCLTLSTHTFPILWWTNAIFARQEQPLKQ